MEKNDFLGFWLSVSKLGGSIRKNGKLSLSGFIHFDGIGENPCAEHHEIFTFSMHLQKSPIGVKVPSTSSLSVYTKVLAHNLNDIRNWASLIGLLLRICWCLRSVFLNYCLDEWKKLVNLIYCFQVLFRMNFKIMYILMKILGNTPSADSAASRDSLSSQNAT